MFATGIISRLSFGWIADRPAPTLLISSSLQAASLLAYFGANGLTSLILGGGNRWHRHHSKAPARTPMSRSPR